MIEKCRKWGDENCLAYMQALFQKKEYVALQQSVKSSWQSVTAIAPLKEIAFYATESKSPQATAIWEKIGELDPNDPTVLLEWGRAAYQQHHYKEAEKVLKTLLTDFPGIDPSYETLYFYGMVLRQREMTRLGNCFLQQALRKIALLKEKPYKAYAIQASIASTLNIQGSNSLRLLCKILCQRADDPVVTADIAGFLMDSGYFKAAKQLLKGRCVSH